MTRHPRPFICSKYAAELMLRINSRHSRGFTSVPVAIGYLFGRKVLSLNPVYLLGAITGSMTSGASLSIVTGEARSSLPALGYTGAYAFANVLLTVAGSLILMF